MSGLAPCMVTEEGPTEAQLCQDSAVIRRTWKSLRIRLTTVGSQRQGQILLFSIILTASNTHISSYHSSKVFENLHHAWWTHAVMERPLRSEPCLASSLAGSGATI
jgi:hypothetical protein